jgi:hypothetical protein
VSPAEGVSEVATLPDVSAADSFSTEVVCCEVRSEVVVVVGALVGEEEEEEGEGVDAPCNMLLLALTTEPLSLS